MVICHPANCNPSKARTCMVCGMTGLVFSAVNIFIPGNFR